MWGTTQVQMAVQLLLLDPSLCSEPTSPFLGQGCKFSDKGGITSSDAALVGPAPDPTDRHLFVAVLLGRPHYCNVG